MSPVKILVINPNSNQGFTKALEPLVAQLGYTDAHCDFFTCPEQQPPLSSLEDIDRSAALCLPHILPYFETHDALLVACFSRHPLVTQLRTALNKRRVDTPTVKPRVCAVTGIFEASVVTAMNLAGSAPERKWGVISTDHSWRQWTDDAITDFMGIDAPKATIGRYLGCETVGVQAEELERKSESVMAGYVKTALELLLRGQNLEKSGAPVIILGCAGLHQLEGSIRRCSKELLGDANGTEVAVVDGVKVGIGMLLTLVKSQC
ncbi:uncharacterized protein DNG_10146 [Cephalotrichum gorgonifer]|uniref:Hydantoin racemase n=1 Tax=Cephalotrichum gorgonifer TaxID=2041049 RepID=A0AAE8N913_9PEZI|nr:uncharacterized protein DNG_10146 [Cephalotrichum gorgonifer]